MTDTGARDRADDAMRVEGSLATGATDAFALLGNETRLAILHAIWAEQVPLAEDNAVPFSRIFDRVDLADSGNFNYHLEQLRGTFVADTEAGYELTIPGLKLVRTIVAGTGVEEPTLAPAEIDQPCPLCGATMTISYRDGVVFRSCTVCEGMAPGRADVDGVVNAVYFEPAGVAERDAEALHAAALAADLRQTHALVSRVCPTCSGPVEGRLESCPDHERGACECCGLYFGDWVRFRCRTCRFFGGGHPMQIALFHPTVVSFFDDHGVSTRVRADEPATAKRVYALQYDFAVERQPRDPPRVAVTTAVDGDAVTVTIDDTGSVVGIDR